MKWITNIYGPKEPDASMVPMPRFVTRQSYREWLEDKVIGEPKATAECSVEQLKAMNIVGVYEVESDQQIQTAEIDRDRARLLLWKW